MNTYDAYIILIFVVKFAFIILSLTHVFMKVRGKTDSDIDKKVTFWKGRLEFIFIFLMSLLLIYLFNPRKSRLNMVTGETKILLYLFGFILIITANWNTFITESKWFKKIQDVLGKRE
jgi:hypothetical protein